MTGGPDPVIVAGRTTITAGALQRLAAGIARDAAGVRIRDVAVSLSDDRGDLRVSVSVPAVLGRSTLVDAGERLRQGVVDGMRALGGRVVGAVDIRYTGARADKGRRAA